MTMMRLKPSIAATTLILAMSTTLLSAQTPTPVDPHHPAQDTTQAPATTSSPAQPPAAGMPMNMMGNMTQMMGMMRSMGMMQPGGMGMIDHVEGRIAFLRTELKITDAQAGAWNTFADALRANAKKLAEVRPAMMGEGGQQSLAARLESQERWLQARYEGTRAIRAAYTTLSGTFSDEQKRAADDLLAPHMDMRMMTMAPRQPGPMMRGQTQSGQTAGQAWPGQVQPEEMQPGQMMPGRMQPRR